MSDPTQKIIAILEQYGRNSRDPIASSTALGGLEIDVLDLPMIVLDVEDAFDIHIRYGEEVEGFATVGDLVTCVASHLEAKASRPHPSTVRTRRPWTCTHAERRR